MGMGNRLLPGVPVALPPLGERPLVSVLVTNFNYAAYVGAAIESVLSQTYPHFEVIVCDDGSTDGSPEVIGRFVRQDARVKLFCLPNGGASTALNAAYGAARGAIICLLDADDLFASTKLHLVVEGFRHSDAGLLVHAMTTIDRTGKRLTSLPLSGALERGWLAPRMLRRGGRWGWQATSGLCLRTELGPYVFPIPASMGNDCQDGFVNTLAPLLTPVAALDLPLSSYRWHGSNLVHNQQMDAAHFQEAVARDQRLFAEVNARLAALGLQTWQLDLSRNLTYRQHRFSLALLRGDAPRLALASQYRRLAGDIMADEVVSTVGKLRSLLAFGCAVALPVAWRGAWLRQWFGESSRMRRIAGALFGRFPGPGIVGRQPL